MRLFVAIEMNDAARLAIADEQKRLQPLLGSAIKWVRPGQLHLTLVFLGEVASSRAEHLIEALQRPIEMKPFVAVFGGLGVFPPHGAARTLWLGLQQGADDVTAMHREIVARISALDLPIEDRSFHPHLTLARWRSGRPADRRRALEADRAVPIARVDVDAVSLVQSQLSSAGSAYTTVCRSRLMAS